MLDSKNKIEIYDVQPLLNYRIWGTSRFGQLMHQGFNNQIYGEAFIASSLENAQSFVNGSPLNEFYQNNKEAFNLKSDEFPLRINMIDTSDKLSIQTHPTIYDDEGKEIGVCEAWVILENPNDEKIVCGHNAQDESSFQSYLDNNAIDEVLTEVDVKVGDVYYLKQGTLHAIAADMLVYEVTNNVDITYRLYDYNRIDKIDHKKRELHIDEVLDTMYYPQKIEKLVLGDKIEGYNYKIVTLIDKENIFSISKMTVCGDCSTRQSNFNFYTCIEGSGKIGGREILKYQTVLILDISEEIAFSGNMSLLLCTYKEVK